MPIADTTNGQQAFSPSEVFKDGTMTPDVEQGLPQMRVHTSKWWTIRNHCREPFAEFLGVCVLIIFGTGVDCQVVLSTDPNVAPSQRGGYISINFGWAIGTAIGLWVAGGISGAHINPAVTLTMAVFRGFPWRKVPIFILSQILGGVLGAAVTYAKYYHAIDIFEGPGNRTLKTAGLFSTYTLDYMTNLSAFFDEFLGTVVLIIAVFAINDKNNSPPPGSLKPFVLFLLILGIGASIGMQTGYAINPARDLGPRILTSMVGYGTEVFTYRDHYWIWCPITGPILGGLFGAFLYDAFLYTGEDNIFTKRFAHGTSPNF